MLFVSTKISGEKVKLLFDRFDSNHSGDLDYLEFFRNLYPLESDIENMKSLFTNFDINLDGIFSL